MAEKTKQEEIEKISRHKFFFDIPLYESIDLEKLEDEFDNFFDGNVDAYNPDGFDTTYAIQIEEMRRYLKYETPDHHLNNFGKFYAISLICRRKGNILRFIVFFDGEKIVKIGQFPSIADIQYAEIGKKYDKILSKKDLHDLKKAIGLMAHGAGAGSLVYLRRIFENIILSTFEKHKGVLKISDEKFKVKRMDEKVSFLKDFLPSQLVEMKAVYGILSKGVHELSEEECLTYFPALKLSIILILDQRIEDESKSKKESLVKKAIADISQKINGKK